MTDRVFQKGLSYINGDNFSFSPDVATAVQGGVFSGIAKIDPTGNFTFIRVNKSHKPATICVKKLPHGRLSKMKDGSLRLTITLPSGYRSVIHALELMRNELNRFLFYDL